MRLAQVVPELELCASTYAARKIQICHLAQNAVLNPRVEDAMPPTETRRRRQALC